MDPPPSLKEKEGGLPRFAFGLHRVQGRVSPSKHPGVVSLTFSSLKRKREKKSKSFQVLKASMILPQVHLRNDLYSLF